MRIKYLAFNYQPLEISRNLVSPQYLLLHACVAMAILRLRPTAFSWSHLSGWIFK